MPSNHQDIAGTDEISGIDDDEIKRLRALVKEVSSTGGERGDAAKSGVAGDLASLHTGSTDHEADPETTHPLADVQASATEKLDQTAPIDVVIDKPATTSETIDAAHATATARQTDASSMQRDENAAPTSDDNDHQIGSPTDAFSQAATDHAVAPGSAAPDVTSGVPGGSRIESQTATVARDVAV